MEEKHIYSVTHMKGNSYEILTEQSNLANAMIGLRLD